MSSPSNTAPVAPAGVSLSQSSDQPYTVITYGKRMIEMYHVLAQELDDLIAGYTSVNLGFFGLMFGATLAILITCTTVPLQDPWIGRYWVAFWSFLILTLYFLVMTVRE